MAKYILAGGCGYIGTSLCRSLLKQGHKVKVIDMKMPTCSIPEVEYLQADLCDIDGIGSFFNGVDGCFYLASESDLYEKKTILAHTRSLHSFLNVLGLCSHSIDRIPFVFLSSESVYGNSIGHQLSEESPLNPVCSKGIDYFVMENHARRCSQLYSVPCTGLRLFNLYGSWSPGWTGDVISACCQKVLAGQVVDIPGDGHQSWDFVHIGDVVTALSSAMQVSYTGYRIFNLCTGERSSLNDIINLMDLFVDGPVKTNSKGVRKQECFNRIGDISCIRRDLNFYHRYCLVEGIRQILISSGEISPSGTKVIYR